MPAKDVVGSDTLIDAAGSVPGYTDVVGDCPGHEIGNKKKKEKTAKACADICDKTSGCVGFSFYGHGGICYAKSKVCERPKQSSNFEFD